MKYSVGWLFDCNIDKCQLSNVNCQMPIVKCQLSCWIWCLNHWLSFRHEVTSQNLFSFCSSSICSLRYPTSCTALQLNEVIKTLFLVAIGSYTHYALLYLWFLMYFHWRLTCMCPVNTSTTILRILHKIDLLLKSLK